MFGAAYIGCCGVSYMMLAYACEVHSGTAGSSPVAVHCSCTQQQAWAADAVALLLLVVAMYLWK